MNNNLIETEFLNHQSYYNNFCIDEQKVEKKLKNACKFEEAKISIVQPTTFLSGKIMRLSDYYKPSKKSLPNIWSGVKRRNLKKNNSNIEKSQPKIIEDNLLVETDEEEKFCQPEKIVMKQGENTIISNPKSKSVWRHSAAEHWYNLLNIPDDSDECDYGFQLKKEEYVDEIKDDIPIDSYLMVKQQQWENEVIWDGEANKNIILQKMKKSNTPYWIKKTCLTKHENIWYSTLPVENQELINGEWENDVIWDSNSMNILPQPKIATFDLNDENIIIEMPADLIKDSAKEEQIPMKNINGKKDIWKLWKKENIAPYELPIIKKDPFNISNDEFYNPKCIQNYNLRSNEGIIIQHSIPALELHSLFYPPNIGMTLTRNFHRPALKPYFRGPLSKSERHEVIILKEYIKEIAELREREREASGGGEMFFMRTIKDLSNKDGELILAEYSEEFPPLMMNIGMATKIKNYYKRKPGKEVAPAFKYGESVHFIHTSPFLGHLKQGQSLQAFENNLFRAPLYEHQMPETDFLIIRTREAYYIREVNIIYTVGQELPLMEVPGPKSKNSHLFTKEFLQVFIYRLFKKSRDDPPRCKLEDIKKAFPYYSESSIRKRLNHCAEFKRTGNDAHWWVLNKDFRLPTEEEIRAMVSPEQYCTYYSMVATQQRLKDAGYGEKLIFTEDENEEEFQGKIDDEIKAAPWNTTRAFIMAMKGKCCLEITGVADPTGCGEGFSYIRIPNKSLMSTKDENNSFPKKSIVGTDADLRKMSQKKGIQLLKSCGCRYEEIKDLSRWEVIHLIKALTSSDETVEESELKKYARKVRPTITDQLEKYIEECQRVFDIQNKVLSSNEILSTDENSTEDDDSDIEEMGRNIENILSDRKTCKQISEEQEEIQRLELQKLMNKDVNKSNKKNKLKNEEHPNKEILTDQNYENKILQITRTYKTPEGRLFHRMETVKKPEIISRYIHIKTSKNSELAKKFQEDLEKEKRKEIRKERKRLQDQLRRLEKNQKRGFYEGPSKKPKKEPLPSNMKCGACGIIGHIRTNKICPMHQPQTSTVHIAMTEEEEKEASDILNDNELVKVEDTKLVLSKRFMERISEVQKKTMILTIRKDIINPKKVPSSHAIRKKCEENRKNIFSKEDIYKPIVNNRCVRNPVVALSTIFEEIWQQMKKVPNSNPFWFPVKSSKVPDYYNIISSPMDLSRIRQKIQEFDYKNREEFLNDVCQIVKNSIAYNGESDILTITAKEMFKICINGFQKNENSLMQLEEAINHDLFNSNLVAFSYILTTIVNKHLKTIPECWPFIQPCNKKFMKDFTNGETPMCLQLISDKIKNRQYHNRKQFYEDVEKIWKNSVAVRGTESQFTKKAKEIVDACAEALEKYNAKLSKVELKDKTEENFFKEIKLQRDQNYSVQDNNNGETENTDSDYDQLARDLDLSPENSDNEEHIADVFSPLTFESVKLENNSSNNNNISKINFLEENNQEFISNSSEEYDFEDTDIKDSSEVTYNTYKNMYTIGNNEMHNNSYFIANTLAGCAIDCKEEEVECSDIENNNLNDIQDMHIDQTNDINKNVELELIF